MIEFIPETHTYLVDGVIVPSVTQIIREVSGADYSSVPGAILNAKAYYGTKVHEWLQAYFEGGTLPEISELMKISTDQVPELMKDRNIRSEYTERAVHYSGRMAGTFDLLANMDGWETLIDHKTTAKYDPEYLAWQCGCYKLCIKKTLGITVDQCYCLWLPKGKAVQFIEVKPKTEEEVEELLQSYEANRKYSAKELPY